MRAGFHPASHYSLWDHALDWLDIHCSALIMWAECHCSAVEFLSYLTHNIQLQLHVQHSLFFTVTMFSSIFDWKQSPVFGHDEFLLTVVPWVIKGWNLIRIKWQWITSEFEFIKGSNQAITLYLKGEDLIIFVKVGILISAANGFLFSVVGIWQR